MTASTPPQAPGTGPFRTGKPQGGQLSPPLGQSSPGSTVPNPPRSPGKSRVPRRSELRAADRNSGGTDAPGRIDGYIRVSTREQATEGLSLDGQRRKLTLYAGSNDLMLGPIHEDAGASAKTIDRDGLSAALRAIRDGESVGLVVIKLDRLTRSLRDLDRLLAEYFGPTARNGRPATLISLNESIDTRTAMGRFALTLIVLIAQWERETIVERTREAFDLKRARGERLGTIPYGFRLDDDLTTLVEDESEQQVLGIVSESRTAGRSFRQIARDLTDRRIPTRKWAYPGLGIHPWQASTVADIFNRITSQPDRQ